MFPESNEHPSLAMTRYIEKMFESLLVREIKRHITGGGEKGQQGHRVKK